MTTVPGSITEAANAEDSVDATVIYAASITEAATAGDSFQATAIFNDSITEAANATDKTGGTAFYSYPPDHRPRLELRSIHDVLTDREPVSDPTDNHDLLRSQRPPRRR